jgi:hypothetical protein
MSSISLSATLAKFNTSPYKRARIMTDENPWLKVTVQYRPLINGNVDQYNNH